MKDQIDCEEFPLAQAAYAAYGKVVEYKNFKGDPMPEFADLPLKIQAAWIAAAEKVKDITLELL